MKNIINPFDCLIGEKLSSIEFVMGYYQFRFDGPCINVYSDPYVIVNGKRLGRNQKEFNNSIISLISQVVKDCRFIDDVTLRVLFESGSQLFFSLKPEDNKYGLPHVITFTTLDNHWSSW